MRLCMLELSETLRRESSDPSGKENQVFEVQDVEGGGHPGLSESTLSRVPWER